MSDCPDLIDLVSSTDDLRAHLSACESCQLLEQLYQDNRRAPEWPTTPTCSRAELLMAVSEDEALDPPDLSFLESHLGSCSRCRAALVVSRIDDGSIEASIEADTHNHLAAASPQDIGEWRAAVQHVEREDSRTPANTIVVTGMLLAAAAVAFIVLEADSPSEKQEPISSIPVEAPLEDKLKTEESISAARPQETRSNASSSPAVDCPTGTNPMSKEHGEVRTSWCLDEDQRRHGPYAIWTSRPGIDPELVQQRAYRHGLAHGTWTQWNLEGSVNIEAEFEEGVLILVDGQRVKDDLKVRAGKRMLRIFDRQDASQETKGGAERSSSVQGPDASANPRDDLPERLGRVEITTGMTSIRADVLSCGKGHELQAPMTIHVETVIDSRGNVVEAEVQVQKGHRSLGNCIDKAVKGGRFPESRRGARVRYPFVLR